MSIRNGRTGSTGADFGDDIGARRLAAAIVHRAAVDARLVDTSALDRRDADRWPKGSSPEEARRFLASIPGPIGERAKKMFAEKIAEDQERHMRRLRHQRIRRAAAKTRTGATGSNQ